MPPYLADWKSQLVAASGAAEIVGGCGASERTAGGTLWLLAHRGRNLSANIHMAGGVQRGGLREDPEPLLWPACLPGRVRLVDLARHALNRARTWRWPGCRVANRMRQPTAQKDSRAAIAGLLGP